LQFCQYCGILRAGFLNFNLIKKGNKNGTTPRQIA